MVRPGEKDGRKATESRKRINLGLLVDGLEGDALIAIDLLRMAGAPMRPGEARKGA